MKWIGQNIYDQIARFRKKVYIENDLEISGSITSTEDLTIAATGNDITIDSDNLTMTSVTSVKPLFTLESTSNSNKPAHLDFIKSRDGGTAANNDYVGSINMKGENDAGQVTTMMSINSQIVDVRDGLEEGRVVIGVQAHGGGGLVTDAIILSGNGSGVTDVSLGKGSGSKTYVAGSLTMGSTDTINSSGVIQVAAQTVIDHDQLANFAANEHYTQANITTVGTIGSGVWNGTAIASNQQKHLMHYQFLGYTTGDGDHYEMPQNLTDGQAPFEHADTSSADGLTVPGTGDNNQRDLIRMGGQLMINASTLKKWTGVATHNNNKDLTIGLFKWTPTDNEAGDMTPALLEEVVIAGKGNNLTRTFATTSFDSTVAVGDIIFTQMKTEDSGNTGFFNSTLEVEF